jgi:hypothetical protein
VSEILNALAKSFEHRQQLAQDRATLPTILKYLCTEDRNLQSGVCLILSSLCDSKCLREELVQDFRIVQRVCMLLADDSSDVVSQDIRSWSSVILSKLMTCDDTTKLAITECKIPLAGAKRHLLGNADKAMTTTLERCVYCRYLVMTVVVYCLSPPLVVCCRYLVMTAVVYCLSPPLVVHCLYLVITVVVYCLSPPLVVYCLYLVMAVVVYCLSPPLFVYCLYLVMTVVVYCHSPPPLVYS